MVAIPNIVFGGRRRWLWLGAALAMVVAGVSLAEVTGGGDPSLQAVLAPAALSPTAAPVVAAEPASAQTAAAEDARPRADAEEQRRMFMLLLLNSAGPLRPYRGLSR